MLGIQLFGPFEAELSGTPIPLPQRSRTEALWACLLLHIGENVPRERLAFMLWPDLQEAEARAELRRHLHWLDKHLAAQTGSSDWLVKPKGRIGWSADASFALDCQAFDAIYEANADEARGAATVPRSDLARAVELQRGELLTGMWDEWIDPFRRRYIGRLEHVLELLLTLDEATGNLSGALATGRRLLELDRFREETHRALIRLHLAAGDRAAATHQFHVCRELLKTKLDVEPMPETAALYRTIRTSNSGQRSTMIVAESASTSGGSAAVGGRHSGKIPTPLTSFVGREEEIARLSASLESCRSLTLVGPGGVGKTRLAVELARRAGAFETSTVTWVDLTTLPRGADPSPEIVAATGPTIAHATDAGDRALDRLCELLSTEERLIVLDGAEHLLPSIGSIASEMLRRCPALRLLVTSREPLGSGGEVVRRVRPMPTEAAAAGGPAAAIALFAERARAAGADSPFSPTDLRIVTDICVVLDGLPLAIELAAARAESRTLREIRDDLEETGSIAELSPSRPNDVPPSQRGVLGAFEWSYRLLNEEERRITRCAAVFAGPFDAADISAVGRATSPRVSESGVTDARDTIHVTEVQGGEASDVGSRSQSSVSSPMLNVIERLVATSMFEVISSQKTRYRMLSPLRAAAWRHAHLSGEAEVLVESAIERIVLRAESISESLDSLRSDGDRKRDDPLEDHRVHRRDHRWAMAHLGSGRVPELAYRLAGALWRPWSLDGGEASERLWVDEALAGSPNVGALPDIAHLRARAMFASGVLAYQHADPEQAEERYQAALDTFRRHGTTRDIWTALDHLAVVCGVLGESERAFRLCEESIALKCEAPAADRADTTAIRADLHMRLGHIDAASTDYEESLSILRHAPGRRRSLLNTLRGLGIIALQKSRPKDAASYFSEGLEISRAWNDQAGCAVWLNELGCLDMERGELAAAAGHFKEALEIHHTQGATQRGAMLLNNLGEIAVLQEDNVLARYYFAHSLRRARNSPEDPRRINTLTNLAEAHAYLGEVLRAGQTASESFELALATEIPVLIHHARSARGLASLVVGEHRTAARHFGESALGWLDHGVVDRAEAVLELGAVTLAEHGDQSGSAAVLSSVGGRSPSGISADGSFRSPFAMRRVERLRQAIDRAGSAEENNLTAREAAELLIAWSSQTSS